jgi:hypothetical protein
VDYTNLNGKGRGRLLDFFTPKCLHRPGWKREGSSREFLHPQMSTQTSMEKGGSVSRISSPLNVYTDLDGKRWGHVVDFFTPKCLHRPGWKREGGLSWIFSPLNVNTDLDGKRRGHLVNF